MIIFQELVPWQKTVSRVLSGHSKNGIRSVSAHRHRLKNQNSRGPIHVKVWSPVLKTLDSLKYERAGDSTLDWPSSLMTDVSEINPADMELFYNFIGI